MIYDAFHCVFFGMAPPKKIDIIWNGFWWSWFLFLSFLGGYPLVVQRFANWNITIIFIGESSRLSSILFAISHSYINHPVCLEIGSTHNYRNYYRYYSNLIRENDDIPSIIGIICHHLIGNMMKIQWIEMDLGLHLFQTKPPGSWSDRSRCGRLLPRLDGQLPSASCKAWGWW